MYLEGKFYYNVRYNLTTTKDSHGEYSSLQETINQSYKSETNDLNELFSDLFEIHRHDGIVGLEIVSVENLASASRRLPNNGGINA